MITEQRGTDSKLDTWRQGCTTRTRAARSGLREGRAGIEVRCILLIFRRAHLETRCRSARVDRVMTGGTNLARFVDWTGDDATKLCPRLRPGDDPDACHAAPGRCATERHWPMAC